MTTKRVAYSYVRFSSKKQSSGDSLRRQTEQAQYYADANDLVLDNSTRLLDLGVSGYTGENLKDGALGGFLAALKLKKVKTGSVLIVENLDRLSREETLSAVNLLYEIVNAGVDVYTLSDTKLWTKASTQNAQDLIYSVMVFSRSHEESALKGRRVRAALDKKRDSKHPQAFGVGPGWLIPKSDKTGWVADEVKAESVAWTFDKYLSGLGVKAICKLANTESKPWFGKADKWQGAQVWRLLTNPAVIGIWELGVSKGRITTKTGEVRENYYPCVVSPDTYYKVQGMLSAKTWAPGRKDATHRNLFQGFIRCGTCGAVMTRAYASSAGKPPAATFTCGNRKLGLTKCPTVPAHRLEPILIPAVYSLSPADLSTSPELVHARNRLAAARAEYETVSANLKLHESWLTASTEHAPPTHLFKLLNSEGDRVKELLIEISRLSTDVESFAYSPVLNELSAKAVLELLWVESQEAIELRATEYQKIKALVKYIFVWPEQTAAVANGHGLVAWIPLIYPASNLTRPLIPEPYYEELSPREIKHMDVIPLNVNWPGPVRYPKKL